VSGRALSAAQAGLSLAGVAVTGYLLAVRWGGGTLYCSTGGCETVQSSSYAEVLGLPVAFAGLLAYLFLGISAFVAAPLVRVAAAAVALAGLAFSAYLLVIQLAVIGEVCQWCVASDVITTLVAAVALLRLREALADVRPPNRPGPRAALPRARSARARRGSPA
jgi:uncharacterized membrane protein